MNDSNCKTQRIVLTSQQLEQIHSYLSDTNEPFNCRFNTALKYLWEKITGTKLCDDGPEIKPWLYAIPRRQSTLILRWISEGTSDRMEHVQWLMQWVNIGPSIYDDNEPDEVSNAG